MIYSSFYHYFFLLSSTYVFHLSPCIPKNNSITLSLPLFHGTLGFPSETPGITPPCLYDIFLLAKSRPVIDHWSKSTYTCFLPGHSLLSPSLIRFFHINSSTPSLSVASTFLIRNQTQHSRPGSRLTHLLYSLLSRKPTVVICLCCA